MINSDNVQEFYSSYIDGELSAKEQIAFEKMLNQHPEKREEFERVQIVCRQMQTLQPIYTSNAFEKRLHERIRREQNRPFLSSTFSSDNGSFWRTAAATAAVVIFATASSVMYFSGNTSSETIMSPAASSMAPMSQPAQKFSGQGQLKTDKNSQLNKAKQDSIRDAERDKLQENIQVVNGEGN